MPLSLVAHKGPADKADIRMAIAAIPIVHRFQRGSSNGIDPNSCCVSFVKRERGRERDKIAFAKTVSV